MTTLPAFMQNYQGRGLAQALHDTIGSGAPPTLSIEGGRFSLHDGGEPEMVGAFDPKIGVYVDVVIIDHNPKKSKTYFGRDATGALKKFDPANPSPPVCFSDNGIGPSTQAGEPQALTCASCPQNVMGSAVSLKGKPAQACRDSIKMAVVLPQYPEEAWLLRVPPNSFKHLRALTDQCAKAKAELEQVVTRIYFEQGVQGTLMFAAMDFVRDEALFKSIAGMIAAKATDGILGRLDRPREGLALPPVQAPVALPAPLPANGGFQPSPLPAPAAAFPSIDTAPTPIQTAAPAPTASPSDPPAAGKRRGRKPTAQAEAPLAAQSEAPVAPFRQAATQAPAAQMAAPAAVQFGMTAGVAPNPEITQALDNILGMK